MLVFEIFKEKMSIFAVKHVFFAEKLWRYVTVARRYLNAKDISRH